MLNDERERTREQNDREMHERVEMNNKKEWKTTNDKKRIREHDRQRINEIEENAKVQGKERTGIHEEEWMNEKGPTKRNENDRPIQNE